MLDTPEDFVNWLLIGIPDTLQGAFAPEDPFSPEHWLDSVGAAGIVAGVARVATSTSGQAALPATRTTPTVKKPATGRAAISAPGKAAKVNITQKIQGQMSKRGWTDSSINKTINEPYTTRLAINKTTPTRNPATAYYNKDGSYVIRDNITGDIIQISKRGDVNWIPDSSIVNPYIPNK